MSSLLQFTGECSHKGVHLQFYRTDTGDCCGKELDLDYCPICKSVHPRIGIAIRKPRGMFGCWVVFEYNGSTHVPDLSVPIAVKSWPRGTVVLTPEQSHNIWKGE